MSFPEYKPGDYIVFTNDYELFVGVVKCDAGIGGAYKGWLVCQFYSPTERISTCEPGHLRPATDAEICLLRLEGKI